MLLPSLLRLQTLGGTFALLRFPPFFVAGIHWVCVCVCNPHFVKIADSQRGSYHQREEVMMTMKEETHQTESDERTAATTFRSQGVVVGKDGSAHVFKKPVMPARKRKHVEHKRASTTSLKQAMSWEGLSSIAMKRNLFLLQKKLQLRELRGTPNQVQSYRSQESSCEWQQELQHIQEKEEKEMRHREEKGIDIVVNNEASRVELLADLRFVCDEPATETQTTTSTEVGNVCANITRSIENNSSNLYNHIDHSDTSTVDITYSHFTLPEPQLPISFPSLTLPPLFSARQNDPLQLHCSEHPPQHGGHVQQSGLYHFLNSKPFPFTPPPSSLSQRSSPLPTLQAVSSSPYNEFNTALSQSTQAANAPPVLPNKMELDLLFNSLLNTFQKSGQNFENKSSEPPVIEKIEKPKVSTFDNVLDEIMVLGHSRSEGIDGITTSSIRDTTTSFTSSLNSRRVEHEGSISKSDNFTIISTEGSQRTIATSTLVSISLTIHVTRIINRLISKNGGAHTFSFAIRPSGIPIMQSASPS